MDVAPTLAIGDTPAGSRSISTLAAVTISGERLRATLAGGGGANSMVRSGDLGLVDVRTTVRRDDGGLIHIAHGGRLDLCDLAAGIPVVVAPVFERGDPRYAWLNCSQAIGKGNLTISADRGARIKYNSTRFVGRADTDVPTGAARLYRQLDCQGQR